MDYPLSLPSAYVGTKQTFGKLTLEPSLRWDGETYHIPNRPDVTSSTGVVTKSYAYGDYSTHALSPRFAFTWAADPYDAIRGSYGVTTTFVPAAYVFNNSPNGITAADSRAISPYYPGATLTNQRNFNVDLSFSHALRNNVDSWRISPFYRHAVDKLELTKPYTVNPVTGPREPLGHQLLPHRHPEQGDRHGVRLEPRRARRRPLVVLFAARTSTTGAR